MHVHPSASLTEEDRLPLVNQHLEHGRSLAEVAAKNGISLRCAYRWLVRHRSGGAASLADLRHSARLQQALFSTVASALSRLGLGRLRNLEPRPPMQRYEWSDRAT